MTPKKEISCWSELGLCCLLEALLYFQGMPRTQDSGEPYDQEFFLIPTLSSLGSQILSPLSINTSQVLTVQQPPISANEENSVVQRQLCLYS